MKIFTAAQIKACDAYTIKEGGLRSIELMERAANKCVNWIKDNLPKQTLFVVLCGIGNNGGDGLAITRLLHQRGFGAKAFLLQFSNDLTPECSDNLQRLYNIDSELITIVSHDTFITDLPPHIVIIDAIFGIGLNKPISGWIENFIKYINQLPNRKISIDMPSGLLADVVPDKDAPVIIANDTLSFEFYKRTFFHPESAVFAGNVHLLDIGLDKNFIANTQTNYKTVDKDFIATIYKPRNKYAHKGDCGRALLIGGSFGKVGAIGLAAKAAIRSGAGLVTALLPNCGVMPLQASVPEAMCAPNGEKHIDKISDWENMNAIGIGPGIGTQNATVTAFSDFIDSCNTPMVVDADALNIIAAHQELLVKLPKGSILTPHAKEFSRLFGDNTNTMIRTDNARIQAMRYNINIVLKGHHTAVITPEGECRYNTTGNAGMATGGSGDVLTGIITGLMAQGYEPSAAATFGVYLHGLAGDMAVREHSQESLMAGDIIDHIGKAYREISNNN